jgi:hypothetical protein
MKGFTRRSSMHRKPVQCDYCNGKLLYFEYKVFIKLLHRKNPPIGAKNLNISTKEIKIYKIEYAKCLRCNAKYEVQKGYYNYGGFRKSNNIDLQPILDIEKEFDSKVSLIINSHNNNSHKCDIIKWHYTIENYNPLENKIIRFVKKLFFIKLHNAVERLLNNKKTKDEKLIPR